MLGNQPAPEKVAGPDDPRTFVPNVAPEQLVDPNVARTVIGPGDHTVRPQIAAAAWKACCAAGLPANPS